MKIDNRTAFSQAAALLQEGVSVRIRVCGQSMLPFFRSGSEILLRPVTPADFRRGTVVLARTVQGTYVVHRIYRLKNDAVTLLGDGNTAGTETMPRSEVFGTVDCSPLHRAAALLWQAVRPLRRWPLALLRRTPYGREKQPGSDGTARQ